MNQSDLEQEDLQQQALEQPALEQPEEKQFHGWRLLRYIGLVVFVLAVISATVDWLVLGPIFDRLG
jgi:uncharacterized membrane protein YcjF (UPF0283 family)